MIFSLELTKQGDFIMKKRFTEEQNIKVIKRHESGAKVNDLC